MYNDFDGSLLRWFNEHIQKKEKTKDDIHKYAKILFMYENSWLNYMYTKIENFKLIRLVDWKSRDVVLPDFPYEWFAQMPDEPQFGSKK